MAKKAPVSAKGLTFGGGWISTRERIIIPSESPELMEEGTAHTKVLIYRKGQWSHHKLAWASTAITGRNDPALEVLVLGVDGEVLRGEAANLSEEAVDSPAKLPGPMRDIRVVGKHAFAVGMGRSAFRRDRPGQWTRVDADLRSKKGDIKGLNSVDGFSESDVYAAGLEGEIWHFDGKAWDAMDSPTNVALQRVLCVDPRQVFIVGMAATLLHLRGGRFEAMEHDVAKENFYGMSWFKGRLYVAGRKLYRLEDDGLTEVDLGLGDGFTCGQLDSNDGVIWSFGARHLAYSTDGDRWTQVFVT